MTKNKNIRRKLRVKKCDIYGVFDENGVQFSPDFAMRYEAVDWLKQYKKGEIERGVP